MLSFGLFIAPSLGPFSPEIQDKRTEISGNYRSRKVLEHHPSVEGVRKFDPTKVVNVQEFSSATIETSSMKSDIMHDDRTLTLSQVNYNINKNILFCLVYASNLRISRLLFVVDRV